MNKSNFNNPPTTLPSGSKAVAYLRDSGGRNQDESIEQQEKAIRDFCEKHGLVLNKIYSDPASGSGTENS